MLALFSDLREMLGERCFDWEIVFGPDYEAVPVLVLTTAQDLFAFVSIGDSDAVLPVCSGDMLFNAFNEYLGFLR